MGSDDDFQDLPDLPYTAASQISKKPQKFQPPLNKRPPTTSSLKKPYFSIPSNKFLMKVRATLTLKTILMRSASQGSTQSKNSAPTLPQ